MGLRFLGSWLVPLGSLEVSLLEEWATQSVPPLELTVGWGLWEVLVNVKGGV